MSRTRARRQTYLGIDKYDAKKPVRGAARRHTVVAALLCGKARGRPISDRYGESLDRVLQCAEKKPRYGCLGSVRSRN